MTVTYVLGTDGKGHFPISPILDYRILSIPTSNITSTFQ
jgi:hypothetical protein